MVLVRSWTMMDAFLTACAVTLSVIVAVFVIVEAVI
jgi:hypothetical protein